MTSLSALPFSTPSLLRQSAELRLQLQNALQESTTGVKSDIGAHLRGDFTRLAGLDQSLTRAKAHDAASAELSLTAEAMQSALKTLGDTASSLASDLMTLSTAATEGQLAMIMSKGAQAFGTAIATLNTRTADRALFGGVVSEAPPLPSPEALLSSLETALAAATSVDDILLGLENWFSSPTGFSSLYMGGAARSELIIGNGERAGLDVTALDPKLLHSLQGLALTALLDRGLAAGDHDTRLSLSRSAADHLLAGAEDLALLAGRVGLVEEKIAHARIRSGAEVSALNLARVEMIESDPYEAAVRLGDLRLRIESFYTITARLSRLSLTEYLR